MSRDAAARAVGGSRSSRALALGAEVSPVGALARCGRVTAAAIGAGQDMRGRGAL